MSETRLPAKSLAEKPDDTSSSHDPSNDQDGKTPSVSKRANFWGNIPIADSFTEFVDSLKSRAPDPVVKPKESHTPKPLNFTVPDRWTKSEAKARKANQSKANQPKDRPAKAKHSTHRSSKEKRSNDRASSKPASVIVDVDIAKYTPPEKRKTVNPQATNGYAESEVAITNLDSDTSVDINLHSIDEAGTSEYSVSTSPNADAHNSTLDLSSGSLDIVLAEMWQETFGDDQPQAQQPVSISNHAVKDESADALRNKVKKPENSISESSPFTSIANSRAGDDEQSLFDKAKAEMEDTARRLVMEAKNKFNVERVAPKEPMKTPSMMADKIRAKKSRAEIKRTEAVRNELVRVEEVRADAVKTKAARVEASRVRLDAARKDAITAEANRVIAARADAERAANLARQELARREQATADRIEAVRLNSIKRAEEAMRADEAMRAEEAKRIAAVQRAELAMQAELDSTASSVTDLDLVRQSAKSATSAEIARLNESQVVEKIESGFEAFLSPAEPYVSAALNTKQSVEVVWLDETSNITAVDIILPPSTGQSLSNDDTWNSDATAFDETATDPLVLDETDYLDQSMEFMAGLPEDDFDDTAGFNVPASSYTSTKKRRGWVTRALSALKKLASGGLRKSIGWIKRKRS